MTPETDDLLITSPLTIQSPLKNLTSPLFLHPLLQNLIDSEVRDPQPKSGGNDAWHEDANGDHGVVRRAPADVLTLEMRPANCGNFFCYGLSKLTIFRPQYLQFNRNGDPGRKMDKTAAELLVTRKNIPKRPVLSIPIRLSQFRFSVKLRLV